MIPGLLAVLTVALVVTVVGWIRADRRLARTRLEIAVDRPPAPGARPVLDLAEEAAGFGLWQLDLRSNAVTLSAGAARLSGFPPVATVQPSAELADRIHPDDFRGIANHFQDAIAQGRDYQIEFRCRQANGEYEWRRQQACVSLVDGRVVQVAGAIVDVHKEKLHLDHLADQMARLELAERTAGVGIWDLDGVANTLTFSPGAAAMRGLPHQSVTMTVQAALDMVHPDDLEAFIHARDRSRAGAPLFCEHRVLLPEGGHRWLRVQGQPVQVNGETVHMTGSVVDIDRERRMLDELRVNAARMRLAEEVAGFGVTDLDASTGRVSFSAGWAALYGSIRRSGRSRARRSTA